MAGPTAENTQQSVPKKNGGRREGAGRKPSTLKGVLTRFGRQSRDVAKSVLAEIDAFAKWKLLSESPDERIRLDTLKYLTDRAFGKPKQGVELSGVAGAPIQTDDVSGLTPEAIEKRRTELLKDMGMELVPIAARQPEDGSDAPTDS